MFITVHLAFIAWGLLALTLFWLKRPRFAVITAFIAGSLFLPNAGYEFPALHNKIQIVSVGLLLCSLIFHGRRWLQLRLGLLDVPMLFWCLWPFASAVANDRETYDALSAILENVLMWGIPYFLGRLYFSTLRGLRDLAVGLLVGGLVYVPLCLWEVRMSPQLHGIVYGFHQHDFLQQLRFGGYRPMVFLRHGLAVAGWMSSVSVLGVWLWGTGAVKHVRRIPIAWLVVVLIGTAVLCKSVGAIVLLLFGCALYFLTKSLKTAIPVLCVMSLPPLYVVGRAAGGWSGDTLVSATSQMVNDERAESLNYRIENENRLIEKALQKKVLGWSRWGRSRVSDSTGRDITATDGMWIIVLGVNGIVGLIVFWASTCLVPVLALLRRCPARYWTDRTLAPAAALGVVLVLIMIDNLFNAHADLIFILAVGGLVGLKKREIVMALKAKLSTSSRQTSLPAIAASPLYR